MHNDNCNSNNNIQILKLPRGRYQSQKMSWWCWGEGKPALARWAKDSFFPVAHRSWPKTWPSSFSSHFLKFSPAPHSGYVSFSFTEKIVTTVNLLISTPVLMLSNFLIRHFLFSVSVHVSVSVSVLAYLSRWHCRPLLLLLNPTFPASYTFSMKQINHLSPASPFLCFLHHLQNQVFLFGLSETLVFCHKLRFLIPERR